MKNKKKVNNEVAATVEVQPQAEVKEVKKKWWEEGTVAYEENDIIYIDPSYDSIGGRFARVVEPSQKPGHFKCKMQNRKTGEEQDSTIIVADNLSTLVAKGGFGEHVLPEAADRFEMDASGIYMLIPQELKKAN